MGCEYASRGKIGRSAFPEPLEKIHLISKYLKDLFRYAYMFVYSSTSAIVTILNKKLSRVERSERLPYARRNKNLQNIAKKIHEIESKSCYKNVALHV